MFTFEVKKKGKDEEFSFEDLAMFHQECYGGKIVLKNLEKKEEYISSWLTCSRCGRGVKIAYEGTLKVVQTAIDGKERMVHQEKEPYLKHLEVRVVQQTGAS